MVDGDKIKRLLFGGTPRNIERKEMTRGQQTAWIIVAMVLLAVLGMNYMDSHDSSDPYSACKSFFASNTCKSDIAMERLNRLQ